LVRDAAKNGEREDPWRAQLRFEGPSDGCPLNARMRVTHTFCTHK
jgi:hypothetical protein